MLIFGPSKREMRRRHIYQFYMAQLKYYTNVGWSGWKTREQALKDVNEFYRIEVSSAEMDSIRYEGRMKMWGPRWMFDWEES